MRTTKDQNQIDIEEAAQVCGGFVLDFHNVPATFPEHKGLPDIFIGCAGWVTIAGNFDPRQVVGLLRTSNIEGIVIHQGGFIPAEIKTNAGQLRDDQVVWWQLRDLKPFVIRTIGQIGRLFGRSLGSE